MMPLRGRAAAATCCQAGYVCTVCIKTSEAHNSAPTVTSTVVVFLSALQHVKIGKRAADFIYRVGVFSPLVERGTRPLLEAAEFIGR